VYQSKFVPVALSAVAIPFWQYATGLVTVGGSIDGMGFTNKLVGGDTQPVLISLTVTKNVVLGINEVNEKFG